MEQGFDARVKEEQSYDQEVNHIGEWIAYLAIYPF
jgi:hypothetical protein